MKHSQRNVMKPSSAEWDGGKSCVWCHVETLVLIQLSPCKIAAQVEVRQSKGQSSFLLPPAITNFESIVTPSRQLLNESLDVRESLHEKVFKCKRNVFSLTRAERRPKHILSNPASKQPGSLFWYLVLKRNWDKTNCCSLFVFFFHFTTFEQKGVEQRAIKHCTKIWELNLQQTVKNKFPTSKVQVWKFQVCFKIWSRTKC